MRVAVLTKGGGLSLGVNVPHGRYPKGVVVLVSNWLRGSYPTGQLSHRIIVIGSCPNGGCPQGSWPRGSVALSPLGLYG